MTNTLENKKRKSKRKQEEREKIQEEREKNHCTKELNKVEVFLNKIEKDFDRLEKHCYHDNDDRDYKRIRQIENLFDEINEDFYKPIKTKGAFNNNYKEYESRGDKDKKLSIKEYLFMIMPYLGDMINNHKAPIRDCNGIIIEDDLSGEWKIQLTMPINFVSSLDPTEIRTMDSKSDNVEIKMGNETNDIIKKLFESFLKNYQKDLEEKMKDSNFVFESVDLLY